MKHILTLLLLFLTTLPLISIGQITDSTNISKSLQGEWIWDYYINVKPSGAIKDTFWVKRDTLPILFGLKIEEASVAEIAVTTENSIDSMQYMSAGPWEISGKYVNFDCDGFIICGHYEIIYILADEIMLKSCSKYEQDGCELTHLIRYKS
ncbi:MAG: hypothetical protein ACWA41_06550 [Putridiphycobacter sp.]